MTMQDDLRKGGHGQWGRAIADHIDRLEADKVELGNVIVKYARHRGNCPVARRTMTAERAADQDECSCGFRDTLMSLDKLP